MSRREPVQSPDPTHGDDFADEHDSVVVDENHTDRRGVGATVRQAVGGPGPPPAREAKRTADDADGGNRRRDDEADRDGNE